MNIKLKTELAIQTIGYNKEKIMKSWRHSLGKQDYHVGTVDATRRQAWWTHAAPSGLHAGLGDLARHGHDDAEQTNGLADPWSVLHQHNTINSHI